VNNKLDNNCEITVFDVNGDVALFNYPSLSKDIGSSVITIDVLQDGDKPTALFKLPTQIWFLNETVERRFNIPN